MISRSPSRSVALLTAACSLASLPVLPCLADKSEDGWQSILNLDDLSDWKMVGKGEFKVVDGALVTGNGMGMLWYAKETIGNARIRVVFKTQRPTDNSGVFIRIDGRPKDAWHAVHHGYEVQIDHVGDSRHRTGTLYSLTEAKEIIDVPPGAWTTMIITLDGDRTTVTINGKLVTDYTEGQPVPPRKKWYEPRRGPRPIKGYIGLQNHDPKSRVHFKEISVQPLPRKRG